MNTSVAKCLIGELSHNFATQYARTHVMGVGAIEVRPESWRATRSDSVATRVKGIVKGPRQDVLGVPTAEISERGGTRPLTHSFN
jgi:hypothetical protein